MPINYGGSGTGGYVPGGTSSPSHSGGGHGIFHNLLTDVLDTAKGIGPGLVASAKHPIRSVEQMGKSEAQMYSPLIHGQFGKFWGNFHAHPLGPLLDALSAATLLAGGLGAGIKGAETAGLLSKGAADIVRAGSPALVRDLPTSLGPGVRSGEIVSHYSPNLFRHYGLQIPTEKAMEKLGKVPGIKSVLGEGGLHPMTPLARGNRKLAELASQHASATQFAMGREFRSARRLLKNGGLSNQEIGSLLNQGITEGVKAHGLKINAGLAQNLEGKDWSYIHRYHPVPPLPEGATLKDWADHIKTKTPFTLTKDPKRAWRDENGMLTAVHKKVVTAARTETENGLRTLDDFVNKPMRLWKWMILANAPRYFVNNVVGNAFMLTAATRPDRLARGIYQAISDIHGTKVAERLARKSGDQLGAEQARLAGSWYHKWYAGPNAGPITEVERVGKKIPGPVANALYTPTEKVAYTGTHMAGVNAAIMETKQFQDIYKVLKGRGMSRTEAFRQAANEASKDPRVRNFVSKRAADWAGQYYHSSTLENALRYVVPFYSWDRHALRFAKEQTLGRPTATNVLVHTGQQGDQYTQNALGPVPDFLKGAIPLGKHGGLLGDILGGVPVGRKKILLTNSFNPLAAAAEDANAIAAIGGQQVGTKGEAVGFQLNPFITGAIQSITGQSLTSGAKVKTHGGLVGGAAENAFGATPSVKILQSLFSPQKDVTSKGKPTLYTHDLRQQIQSAMGLPVRNFSPESAAIYLAKSASKSSKKKKGGITYG